MALNLLVSLPTCNFPIAAFPSIGPIHLKSLVTSRSDFVSGPVQCKVSSKISSSTDIVRRSADYQPPIWDYDYIQSLRSEYLGEEYTGQVNKLKEQVRMMLHKVMDPLEQLEMIDTLQRLGLCYHFESEMKRILEGLNNNNHGGDLWKKENLYATALKFRLFRQHGYSVSEEVFNSFMERGSFKACLCDDTKGMLALYEASFFSIEGENILDEARDFSKKHLQEFVKQNKDQNLSTVAVSHALELPLHWRILRVEARWFIDVYRSKEDMNPTLLKLAELDFNMVQATHQEDLKQVSRWWRSIGIAEKLSFARDRLTESFFWTVGCTFDPHFGYCRRISTKVNVLITVLDDIYDVYGTVDELELFTDVVERWDINAMDGLPNYMKICFLALHNSVNEMAFDILKEQEFHIIRYLKKTFSVSAKISSIQTDPKWYYSGYTPRLQEYLENACFSIAAPTILLHAYCSYTNPITKEALDCLEEYPNIVRLSSMILRLANDLGTSTDELKKGDVSSSIQCYMNETGASEEDAREYIRCLISATWKKMNEERSVTSPFSETFIEIAFNLGRMAQCIYQYGDGHGVGNHETKDRLLSLFVQPIPPYKD